MSNSKPGSGELSGFLGKGTELNGEIRFQDTLRVDGKITGKVISENQLIIGETGEVNAEVEIGTVMVSGKMGGTVTVRDRMVIHRNAAVRAEIHMEKPCLVIEEGGIFEGRVEMGQEKDREIGRNLGRDVLREKEKRGPKNIQGVAVLDN